MRRIFRIVPDVGGRINWQKNWFVQTSFQNAKSNWKARCMLHYCRKREQQFKAMVINRTEASKQSYFSEVPRTITFNEPYRYFKKLNTLVKMKCQTIMKKRKVLDALIISKQKRNSRTNISIPNCERTSILREPFCSNLLDTRLSWQMYKIAKWASHRRIRDWRILLLILWLKTYIKKNTTERKDRI